jgi:hypothetical protein
MAQTVAQHSVASFTSPVNGTSPIDANQVRGNDNTLRSGYNDHDSDPGIHLQSSAAASRPAAGELGRKWLTTDTGSVRLYFDTGSAWAEVSYLPLAGGTIAGNVSITGTLAVTNAITATGGVVGNVTGNASTATALATARTINGVSFDGTANITVTADAGTLTGSTLASGVTASSLTSVGTLANLTVTNPITGSVTGSSGSTTGNAATATALQTARAINGTSFNGTADITVTAAAGTLTGSTLASGVTASSLTSVGTLSTLAVSGTTTLNTVAYTWPSSGGSNGQVLTTNGSGTLSWTTISGGGGTTTNSLTAGSFLTGGSFNGSAAVTFAVDATDANTASKVVARDSSGNFSAGTITAALSGNASTAATLQTSRNINGVAFNGSADITVTAAAGTLTGTTLASGVTASSLTSVGTIATGVWQGTAIGNAYIATGLDVAKLTTGTTLPSNVTGSSLTSVGTLSSLTLGGTVSMADNVISRPRFTDYAETYTTPAISSNTLTLNLENGNVFRVTRNANISTLTISNPAASGNACSFTLIFDANGTSYTITWPAAVKWPGGTAPTITTTNSRSDMFVFYTNNAGTTWYAMTAAQNFVTT